MKKYLLISIFVVLVSGCDRKVPVIPPPEIPIPVTPQAKAINTQSLVLAQMMVKTNKECKDIGIDKIDDCAVSDKKDTAIKNAKETLKASEEYVASCQKDFSPEFCSQLILRQIQKKLIPS